MTIVSCFYTKTYWPKTDNDIVKYVRYVNLQDMWPIAALVWNASETHVTYNGLHNKPTLSVLMCELDKTQHLKYSLKQLSSSECPK